MKAIELPGRIQYLDGLRGIAILLVLLYHAYTRWPKIVPYGHDFANFPLFSNGWLGVNLFFMISGFVILMTLDKCKTFSEFLYRRWLRLFPAMLICSLIIFSTATFFSERPAGLPVMRDLLPGLTFIEPSWLQLMFGSEQGYMEGAFWSLYVEFKFYIIAAILYFWFGRKSHVVILFTLFMTTEIVTLVNRYEYFYIADLIGKVFHQLSFQYFGWFTSGASFYLYASSGNKRWLTAGIVIALISSVLVRNTFHPVSTIAAITISLLFAASIVNIRLQAFLGSRVFLFFGFISYPLYLLHENMMVSMIIKLGAYFPDPLYFTLPAIPVLFITGLAYIVAKYLETPLKLAIKRIIRGASVTLRAIKPGTKVNTEG